MLRFPCLPDFITNAVQLLESFRCRLLKEVTLEVLPMSPAVGVAEDSSHDGGSRSDLGAGRRQASEHTVRKASQARITWVIKKPIRQGGQYRLLETSWREIGEHLHALYKAGGTLTVKFGTSESGGSFVTRGEN